METYNPHSSLKSVSWSFSSKTIETILSIQSLEIDFSSTWLAVNPTLNQGKLSFSFKYNTLLFFHFFFLLFLFLFFIFAECFKYNTQTRDIDM